MILMANQLVIGSCAMKTLTESEFQMLESYRKLMDGPCYQDQSCDVYLAGVVVGYRLATY